MELFLRIIRILIIVAVFSSGLRAGLPVEADKHSFKRNTIEEINKCEGALQLTLTRIWGDDDAPDENQFFRIPSDLKIGKDGLVYIVDTESHWIQVFKRTGFHERTIGQRGQGPGDLFYPLFLDFDDKNNLIVSDSGNRRFQTLDQKGNYLASFKTWNQSAGRMRVTSNNHLLVLSLTRAYKTGKALILCNMQGEIKKEIGRVLRKCNSIEEYEPIVFAVHKEHIYLTFLYTPVFLQYSDSGDLLKTVVYEVPFKIPGIAYNSETAELSVDQKSRQQVSASMCVDKQGRIYIASVTKPPRQKEKRMFVPGKPLAAAKTDAGKTDRFRILVFEPSGKIIAAKRLGVNCNDFYIHEDSLFVIDSFVTKKIYEYKMAIPPGR